MSMVKQKNSGLNERRLSRRAKPNDHAESGQPVEAAVRASSVSTAFTARFSEMVLINFEVDGMLLKRITPKGLEPDLYNGHGHISMVAKTIRGLKYRGIPLSRDFASLSLQLYVKEPSSGESTDGDEASGNARCGTVFLKHYAQRSMAAWFLTKLTNCDVVPMPMKHSKSKADRKVPPDIEYQWKVKDKWNDLRIRGRSRVTDFRPDSKIAYILRHSDRYSVDASGVWRCELTTPEWIVWDVAQAKFDCDVARVFGSDFVKAMSRRPASVFLSRGNEVAVSKPVLVS